MDPGNNSRQRGPKPQQQIIQNTHDTDRKADNKEQQTCKGNTHHIKAIPQGPDIPRTEQQTH